MQATSGTDDLLVLQQKLARVQALLEAARQVHSTIRLEEVLSITLDLVVKELEAEGAFLQFHGAHFDKHPPQICGSVPHDWTQVQDWTKLPGYSAVLLPGQNEDAIAHLIAYRPAPLSFEETDFLEGLGLQSAMAVANANHHERMIEWERLQADLDAARAIQRSLLPQSVPDVPGYSLRLRSTTCYEVGGDYVDVVPCSDGRLMIVLADVAGKGLASAMMSMTFRSTFRAMINAGLPLEEMAARMNTLHYEEGPEARRRYVTAVFAQLDPRTHILEVVNAGHTRAFVRCRENYVKVGSSGVPLGLLPGRTYERESVPMAEDSQLLLYTDGLTEVFQGDEEFGEERLLELLPEIPDADLLDQVWTTLAQFAGNARQTDDMTALYLFRGAREEVA